MRIVNKKKLGSVLKFSIKKTLLCTVLQLFAAESIVGQNHPVKLLEHEISISGSFGEFRGNHIHAGIDFKTGKKEGIPVLAATDGYVYRILVSRTGYGKAIYLNHENNLTTVYAHLRAFSSIVEDTVSNLQKKQRHFEIDHFPTKMAIKVKKGQVIGYSGNSGSSEGPHLHFETRNTALEMPFDPSMVGISYPDQIPPSIQRIFLYDLQQPQMIFPLPNPRSFQINQQDTIPIGPFTVLGLEAFDLAGNEPNRLGIRSIKVYLDNQPFLYFENGPFTFGQSSHITAMIDQKLRRSGIESFLCLRAEGNKLPFYKMGYEGGIITAHDGQTIICKVEVVDRNLNMTEKRFVLSFSNEMITLPHHDSTYTIRSGEKKSFNCGPFTVAFEENSLHGASPVSIDSLPGQPYSFKWGPEGISINKSVKISYDLSVIPQPLREKTIIVRSQDGKEWTSIGGKIVGQRLEASSSNNGIFSLRHDNEGPELGTLSYFKDDYTGKRALLIKIKDELSGVETIRCKIDGHWVVSEYNSNRNELIIYDIEKFNDKKLEIKAIDKRSNETRSQMRIKTD
ncbi:MAG: M23 family metallopeptidase [Bacteroidia bacterium]